MIKYGHFLKNLKLSLSLLKTSLEKNNFYFPKLQTTKTNNKKFKKYETLKKIFTCHS